MRTRTTVDQKSTTSILAGLVFAVIPMAGAEGRVAYVGSYTGFDPGQLGWVGTTEAGKGISVFRFDEATGKLAPTGTTIEQVTGHASPLS